MMRGLLIVLLLAASCANSNGQILISILLGDKLNSDKLEFGIEGGLSLSNTEGLSPSSSLPALNLGFYFDIRLKNPSWMLHTGILAKSTMGAKDLPVYSLNDPGLDSEFSSGSVIRKIGYFHLPVLMKHQWKNNFFVEAGPMFGLMNRATDEFVATINKKNDLSHTLYIRDRYRPLDAGLMGGLGYRLLGGNGMNLGVRYYYGLVDITKDNSTDQFNRSLYFYVNIPIGAGKKPVEEKK